VITCNKIGFNGKLGNQIFKYSALMALSEQIGTSFFIPYESLLRNGKLFLYDCFYLDSSYCKKDIDISNYYNYEEPHFHYDDNFFNLKDNTNINGFFQSEKYFINIAQRVKTEFVFKQDIENKANDIISQLNNKPIVSLHVRRCDYLQLLDKYFILDNDYYYNAVNQYFSDDYNIFICSDDIDWCKGNLKFKNMYFSTEDTYTDLCIMSLCNHNIIANSSFSWWGAYLNKHKDKNVICPSQWFKMPEFNTKDLFPNGWIIL
jgi:hypothetical protein